MTGLSVLVGTVVGTTPAILVICLSRARGTPWRSVLVLVGGATLGFILIGLPWAFFPGTLGMSWLVTTMLLIGPVAGGALATRFLSNVTETRRYPLAAAVSAFLIGLVAGTVVCAMSIIFVFARIGAFDSTHTLSRYAVIPAFIVYVILGSVAFAAAVRRIAWDTYALVKGFATGLLASVFVVVGLASFAIPSP